jgi:hypothetical protein
MNRRKGLLNLLITLIVKIQEVKFILTIILLFSILPSPEAQIVLRIVHQSDMESDGKTTPASLHISDDLSFEDSTQIEIYLRKLLSELHSEAYLAASIDSLNYSDSTATAYLYTGKQYNRVNISPDTLDEEVIRRLNIRARKFEKPLSFKDFRKLQDKILSHYENSGYPFVKVYITDPVIDEDMISGVLSIEKNTLYKIDKIHILGDIPVNVKHLYRHIGISPGDPYNEKKFQKAGVLIRETAFLTEVRAPEMEFMSNSADMYLYLGAGRPASSVVFSGSCPVDRNSDSKLQEN